MLLPDKVTKTLASAAGWMRRWTVCTQYVGGWYQRWSGAGNRDWFGSRIHAAGPEEMRLHKLQMHSSAAGDRQRSTESTKLERRPAVFC